MPPAVYPILPAQLLQCEYCRDSAPYAMSRLQFKIPLRHNCNNTEDEYLELNAYMVYAETSSSDDSRLGVGWARRIHDDGDLQKLPIMLYLCGGPGADNPPNRNVAMNQWLLENGYSVLYVDYRGCGKSSPVHANTLLQKLNPGGDREIANFITNFCQDNIVRDLEAIRLCLASEYLCRPTKWTILGQSYGGYISLTYLSMFPEGLQEIFITGGLPPCGMNIDEYFRVEYQEIVAQNEKFYARYLDAHILVREILNLIQRIGPPNIEMTGRGYLSGHKLLTLGRQFGSKVGFPEVYNLLQRIKKDLEQTQRLSQETIIEFESILHVDERPLYPILLEQTWASGGKTRWAAEHVAREIKGFEYLQVNEDGNYCEPANLPADNRIYFTANTYCRFHYDTHEELVDLKGAAEILAEHDWECPYDYKMLAANPHNVPVYAISFEQDMHLDVGVAAETAAKVGGLKLVVDPGWHQDIRYRPAEVLENLFRERAMTKDDLTSVDPALDGINDHKERSECDSHQGITTGDSSAVDMKI
ncbi:unnamed protein product [Discula destructiva]